MYGCMDVAKHQILKFKFKIDPEGSLGLVLSLEIGILSVTIFEIIKFCTVRCAAVGYKIAAFYCFMFPEAKKQQDLIKFTPDFSWRVLE